MFLDYILLEGHERARWRHAHNFSFVHNRYAIFNDCFLLRGRHAPLNCLTLSPFERCLVILVIFTAVHPAFRRDYAIACIATQILYILQRVTKLALSCTRFYWWPLHLLLSDIVLTMTQMVIGPIDDIISTESTIKRWLCLLIWLTIRRRPADNRRNNRAFRDTEHMISLVVDLIRIDRLESKVWVDAVSTLVLVVILVKFSDNCRSEPLLLMWLKLNLRCLRVNHVVWVHHVTGRLPVLLVLSKQTFSFIFVLIYNVHAILLVWILDCLWGWVHHHSSHTVKTSAAGAPRVRLRWTHTRSSLWRLLEWYMNLL